VVLLAHTKPGTSLIPRAAARHYQDGVAIDGIVRLEIVEATGGVYLFHFDAEGQNRIDTWHGTVEEALDQAAFEYGLGRDAWDFVTSIRP
jgi:hypothetical protein